ncbi:MAG: hypothetical protein EOO96_02500 [Pedobacter sp.]|nr:MAG: hypothetical protein EOO96_02500 [Pedobacter sp.]
MLKLLVRTFGFTFYQQHAGLFVVFFYLLFGMIQGYDLISFHLALLISICSSPINLTLLFLFWTLYSLKCLHFVTQQLKQDDYRFINTLSILPKFEQLKVWVRLYAFLLMPVLFYSVFVLATAIRNQYYFTAFATVFAVFILLGALAYQTFRATNFASFVSKQWIKLPVIKLNKPFWSWPIFYLVNEQRLVLLLCKMVSILFFKVILWVFADVGNDVRVYLTATLAVVLSHAILVLNLLKFDAVNASFAKHLPIGAYKRFAGWILVYLILLSPEFIVVLSNKQITFSDAAVCIAFAIGAILFLQSLVYSLKADEEKYMRWLLFFFFVTMLAILANYFIIYTTVAFAYSLGFYLLNYQRLDYKNLTV